MKKCIVLVGLILVHAQVCGAEHSREIVLPLAPMIAKRLSELRLTHFVRTTKIHTQLGGIKIHPINIASRVLFIIDEYTATNVAPYMAQTMEEKRPLIIKALAQDYPEAVAELELLGVFEQQKLRSSL